MPSFGRSPKQRDSTEQKVRQSPADAEDEAEIKGI